MIITTIVIKAATTKITVENNNNMNDNMTQTDYSNPIFHRNVKAQQNLYPPGMPPRMLTRRAVHQS